MSTSQVKGLVQNSMMHMKRCEGWPLPSKSCALLEGVQYASEMITEAS